MRATAPRQLSTVLITDIVGSTERAIAARDQAWTEELELHEEVTRKHVDIHGGRTISFLGDGVMATFGGPNGAISAAIGIRDELARAGLPIRAGVHCGEVVIRGDDLAGVTVHVASRISGLAPDGTVLTSNVVRELATGSEIHFEEQGTHRLKGVPGTWKLFTATVADPMTGPSPTSADPEISAEKPAVPTVLLVDDHPLWRQSLASMLERGQVGRVVAQAGCVREAIQAAVDHQPDVIVMDVGLPDGSGIEATREIVMAAPGRRVVMLSSSEEQPQVLAAIRAGAVGYLLKTTKTDDILDAITRVHAGEAVFPARLSSVVLDELRAPSGQAEEPTPLTNRELAVLELMAMGRSNEAISQALHVSGRTIEAHVTSIYSKLDLPASPDENRRVLAVLTYVREHGPLR